LGKKKVLVRMSRMDPKFIALGNRGARTCVALWRGFPQKKKAVSKKIRAIVTTKVEGGGEWLWPRVSVCKPVPTSKNQKGSEKRAIHLKERLK